MSSTRVANVSPQRRDDVVADEAAVPAAGVREAAGPIASWNFPAAIPREQGRAARDFHSGIRTLMTSGEA